MTHSLISDSDTFKNDNGEENSNRPNAVRRLNDGDNNHQFIRILNENKINKSPFDPYQFQLC